MPGDVTISLRGIRGASKDEVRSARPPFEMYERVAGRPTARRVYQARWAGAGGLDLQVQPGIT